MVDTVVEAMILDLLAERKRRLISNPGPVKAPSSAASFQSPAPRLRRRTKGSSNPRPTKAPSREILNPSQP